MTATDARLTRKLQALMAGVGGICLLLALVTVASATLALLEERRKEMALFLSLGYTGRWVQGLITGELSLVGLASVVAGSLAGEAAAAASGARAPGARRVVRSEPRRGLRGAAGGGRGDRGGGGPGAPPGGAARPGPGAPGPLIANATDRDESTRGREKERATWR